jgi:Lon protease-like protein
MSGPLRELALFPLNMVLFPGGPLPLRIFETRYLDMVRQCMREGKGFGVVLIARGREAQGSPRFVETGTEASIVDFSQLDDGLLGISCVGRERFRIVDAWQQPDRLNVGRVEDVPAEAETPVPGEFGFLVEALQKILPELGDFYAGVPRRFGDAAWVGHRLAEILPLATTDKQALLEMRDPVARLAALAPAIRRQES